MRIIYVADFFLPSNKAYSIHVFQMLDAFGKLGLNSQLLIPYFDKSKIKKSLRFYGLFNKKKIRIDRIFKKEKNFNFLTRIIFGLNIALTLNKSNSNSLVITRSLSSSVFLSLFKIHHFLEIHQEIQGLSKFLLVNLNFINSNYIIKNIFISKSLARFYKNRTKKFIVLHDGVNLNRFKFKKKIKKIKKISYIGSFYKGRGVELIIEMAKKLKKFKFYLYGRRDEKFLNLPKNIFIKSFVNQSKVPSVLTNSDLLLLPYERRVMISTSSSSPDNSKFMSPLKLFESLASGTPIICSEIAVLKEVLKHNYNSILVKKFENKFEWVKEITKLSYNTNKLKKLSVNGVKTAKKYTWENRAKIFIKEYKKKNLFFN